MSQDMSNDQSQDCIFCKIVAGDVPAELVAQSEHAVAFRDLNPQAPTHVLVIPRVHVANAYELAEREPAVMPKLFSLAHQIAQDEELSEGYRMVFNTGAGAGQTVFHAHLHLLGGRSLGWPPG